MCYYYNKVIWKFTWAGPFVEDASLSEGFRVWILPLISHKYRKDNMQTPFYLLFSVKIFVTVCHSTLLGCMKLCTYFLFYIF